MFVAKKKNTRGSGSKLSSTNNTTNNNANNDSDDNKSAAATSITATANTSAKSTSSQPTTVELRGIPIHFPFKPYKCQETYMEKVLDALNNSENALLESPTGTGKTLCLLCSTLAWQQEQKRIRSDQQFGDAAVTAGNMMNIQSASASASTSKSASASSIPTILYASRTHSQLSQVVQEMRFTRYRPNHAVLGSREQMCVHPKLRPKSSNSKSKKPELTSSEINHQCTRMNKERKCRYRNNLDGFVVSGCNSGRNKGGGDASESQFGMQPVLDMEDLLTLGHSRSICPFYLTREQIPQAEILFVPYNYLFDADARKTTLADVRWEDSILVFDEAHNLESFASDSASFDLSGVDVAGCVVEIQRAMGYLQAMPEIAEGGSAGGGGGGAGGVKMENLIRLKGIFLQFEEYLEEKIDRNGGSFAGEYIFEIFAKGANLNYANHGVFIKFMRQVSDMVMEMRGGGGSAGGGAASSGTPKLDHFVGCVKRIFGTSTEGQCLAKARAYRVHVSAKSGSQSGAGAAKAPNGGGGGFMGNARPASGNSGRVLSYWCFAPSLAMHELAALNVRSILVTSGTLSPLPSYSLELGLPFPHSLENAHIISKDQISVNVIGKGVSGKALTSTYNRRNDAEYITELGNTIISLSRVIPGGVLIFFPSYGVMETCIERWGGPASSRSRNQTFGKKNFFQARQKRSNAGGTGRYCFPHSVMGHNQKGSATATPWQRLMSVKAIVLEPKTTAELKDVIHEFDNFISAPKSSGCIMMGVCRGKISEGIDFADEKCRAVIITGLPFAPYLDPKVKLKREYLDGVKTTLTAKPSADGGFDTGSKSGVGGVNGAAAPIALSGAEWYSQQAHRAVNQAIGRVIRHRADYGAILFLDSRFSEQRNQQGVSKWIRPSFQPDSGVGGAIQSLVKFFRGAKAKAAANKALLDGKKEAGRGIQLNYERDTSMDETRSDGIHSAEKMTKIAFVKKIQSSEASSDKSGDEVLQGYVPPDRIIKQVKLNESRIANKEKVAEYVAVDKGVDKARGLASLYKSSLGKVSNKSSKDLTGTIESAWSRLDRKSKEQAANAQKNSESARSSTPAKEQQKQQAQLFFKLAMDTLSSEDFAKVRKMLVALKASGDKKDKSTYIKIAGNLIKLLLQYEAADALKPSEGAALVNLLHSLLPVIYRFQIECIACEVKFQRSAFFAICSKSLSPNDVQMIRKSLVPKLMVNHDKWKNDPNYNHSDQSRLRSLRAIIDLLLKMKLAGNTTLLQSLYALLTQNDRNTAKLLIREERAKRNMELLKERDRLKYGEKGINKALFHRPDHTLAPSKEPTEDLLDEDIKSMKRALLVAHAKKTNVSESVHSKMDETLVRVKKQLNPYLSKKLAKRNDMIKTTTSLTSSIAARPSKRARSLLDRTKTPRKSVDEIASMNKSMQTPNGLDPLEVYLQQAKEEIYRKATPKIVRMNRMLKSNAPDGTVCNICHKNAKSFFMAECNHFSCLDCWASWLKRSQTCPTCREPASKDRLSRVVFEREVGAGAPSLTQIENCSDKDETVYSDEELELVTNIRDKK